MAADNFEKCLAFVLKYEGGRSEDKHDPGGRTMEGVTQATYDAWLKKQGRAAQDVFSIPEADRDAIYRTEFWDEAKGDTLRPGEDLVVFDLAVNSGPHRALHIWNEGGGGQATLNEIINKVCSLRLSFLQELRTWQYFGTGWARRVMACNSAALKMAVAAQTQPTVPLPQKPIPSAPWPSQPHPSPIPQSPSAAGRQAAILDQLISIQETYEREIAALQKEKSVIDQTIQNFSGFLPPPSNPVSLPPPSTRTAQLRSSIVSNASDKLATTPALSSTTIWGALLSMAGPFIGPLATNLTSAVPAQWQPVVSGAITVIGGIIAIYGRNNPNIAPIQGILKSK